MAVLSQRIREVAKFASVGVINTAIDVVLFYCILEFLTAPIIVANTVSYSAGICSSFVLNKYWTFGHLDQRSSHTVQLVSFIFLSVAGLVISTVIVLSLSKYVDPMFAKLVSVLAVFAWNFVGSRYLVFR